SQLLRSAPRQDGVRRRAGRVCHRPTPYSHPLPCDEPVGERSARTCLRGSQGIARLERRPQAKKGTRSGGPEWTTESVGGQGSGYVGSSTLMSLPQGSQDIGSFVIALTLEK